MTKFLSEQARVSGTFPVQINGVLSYLTEGQNFTDSASLLSALDGAGISYETQKLDATTGTASGRIRINGTGSTVTVGVNGTFTDFAVNAWFTPTAAQLEALQRAPYLVLETEYTDQTPSAFSFTDATNVTTSSTQTSDTITVAGLGVGVSVAVSITGGTYSKNGGSYVSSAGTAINGDTFAVRHTASASAATAVNTVLTIGGVSDTFTSTTTASVTLGSDLVTNGGYADATSWTGNATISGGALHFTSATDATIQSRTQTLAGGSVPAGTYRTTIDVTVLLSQGNAGTTVQLLGAGSELRGSASFPTTGAAQTADIVASGEVTKIQIRNAFNGDDATVDNVKLQSVS